MTPDGQPDPDPRSAICNVFLVSFSVIAIPALAASLFRSGSIGWQPVMALQIVMASLLWGVTAFRRRLPYPVRAGFVLLALISVGLAGLWQLSLVAGGIAFLVIAPALGTIFFGTRGGTAVLALTVLPAMVVGVVSVAEHRLPSFDLAAYLTSASAWTNAILAWLFTGVSSVLAIALYNRHFASALDTARRHATALDASEREYRSILDNMADTFCRTDREGRIVMASPSAQSLLGYSPEELVGMTLGEFFVDPDRRAEFLVCLDGRPVNGLLAALSHRDQREVWVSITARPWKDREHNERGVEGIFRDITAHKESEDALRQSQNLQAIGQLTGGIAHDFNNMLNVTLGNAEFLLDVVGDDKDAQRHVAHIIKASERGAALTARLLAFSRKQSLSPKPTEINPLILGLTDMLQRTLGETIELRTHLDSSAGHALVDRHQLENALLNLVMNARDAMPNGGVLTIETARVALNRAQANRLKEVAAGNYVKITVGDTGTGMSDETKRRAFDPFFTTKDVGKGSGVGLSMVYGFAKQSRGHIEIDSALGRGTTVQLSLPGSEEAAEEGEVTPEIQAEAPRGERILVVEDDESLRKIALQMLQNQGYHVAGAHTGQEALRILGESPPFDLLFTDLVLPGGMDGLAIAEEARRLRPEIKILYTTGYSDAPATRNGALVPGVTLAEKPYARAKLLQMIRNLLDRGNG